MTEKIKERKDNETAWLPSAGLGEKRATLHEFARYEPVAADSLKYSAEHGPRGTRQPVGVIYRCTETGAERRWGIE